MKRMNLLLAGVFVVLELVVVLAVGSTTSSPVFADGADSPVLLQEGANPVLADEAAGLVIADSKTREITVGHKPGNHKPPGQRPKCNNPPKGPTPCN